MKKIEDLKKKALGAVLIAIPVIVGSVVSNMQAKSEAKEDADEGSTAVLKSYEPIIEEIHTILDNNQLWVQDADADLDAMGADLMQLRADMAYCMAYVDFDSRGGNFHPEPMAIAPEKPSWRADAPTPSKPMAKVPDNIQKAEQYIKARKEQKCAPGDPLCGSDSL